MLDSGLNTLVKFPKHKSLSNETRKGLLVCLTGHPGTAFDRFWGYP